MIERRGRAGRSRRRPDGAALRSAARRLAFRHRRPLAAVLAFAAVLAGVSAVRPAPEPSRVVVVAARDVPAGARLTAGDLATVTMPVRWAPPAVLAATAAAEGRVALGPLAAGEPLTPTRLVGGDRAAAGGSGSPALPAGLVAAPVRVADAGAAALVSAGDTVDVVAATEADSGPLAQVVAREVRVLAVPRRSAGSGGGGLLAGSSDTTAGAGGGSLLVLAVTPPTALALARAAVSYRLSLVLHVE